MTAWLPLADNHPLKAAWDEYKKSEQFANSWKWAQIVQLNPVTPEAPMIVHPHLEGSFWAMFMNGFNAGVEAAKDQMAEDAPHRDE